MSAEKNPGLTIVLVILYVSVCSALLAAAMWKTWKEVERSDKDVRHQRRVLLRTGLLYVCCAMFGIVAVLTGREPKEILLGLPIAVGLAWAHLRAAFRVKLPPA